MSNSTQNDEIEVDGETYIKWDTQNDWAKQIIFHLENLIIDIGTQVTDDYKEKNGLYEGMSIKNVISRDKYKKIFIELLADARREVITGETSDGYHTFNELYEFRKLFNALLFNEWAKQGLYDVHKSLRHSDGEKCFGGGWFIVMAKTPEGQISNHYELKDWDLFKVQQKVKAEEWDGHTAKDVVRTLKSLATLKEEK